MALRVLKWLVIAVLGAVLGALHACGLTAALWSTLFPLAYDMALTTVVDYQGERIENRTVTACRIIDRTKTRIFGYDVQMPADPPFFALRDGSVLILSPTPSSVCRWHTERPPAREFRFNTDRPVPRKGSFDLFGEAFHFDNPSRPTVLHIHDLRSLMDRGSADHLLLESFKAVLTDERPQYTVRSAIPFAKWAEKKANHKDGQAQFLGIRAKLMRSAHGSQCPALPVSGSDWVRITPNPRCTCAAHRDGCWMEIGSLKPHFSTDYGRVDFKSDEVVGALGTTLIRMLHLKAQQAPLTTERERVKWHPQVCVDGRCEEMAVPGGQAHFYHPTTQLILQLGPSMYSGNGLPHGTFERMGPS